ncbi:unnamed protein product [Lota lota]
MELVARYEDQEETTVERLPASRKNHPEQLALPQRQTHKNGTFAQWKLGVLQQCQKASEAASIHPGGGQPAPSPHDAPDLEKAPLLSHLSSCPKEMEFDSGGSRPTASGGRVKKALQRC